jgi:hypothetical protein
MSDTSHEMKPNFLHQSFGKGKITEPEQTNPCYVEESAIASTSQLDKFSETLKTVFKNYEIGPSNPNRLMSVVTVDQEEYKWNRQLRESIPVCVLDPGDFHFLLNVLKAFAKIYCPAGPSSQEQRKERKGKGREGVTKRRRV